MTNKEVSAEILPLTEAFFYILLSLSQTPSHGYGIMQDVERMSGKRVRIGAGTLYTALGALRKKGLIQSAAAPDGSDPRRKMYAITQSGQHALQAEANRLQDMVKTAQKILQGARKA